VELREGLQILYRGQSNVAVLADQLNLPLETLKREFRDYVSVNPIDPDVWKGDVEIAWPYIT